MNARARQLQRLMDAESQVAARQESESLSCEPRHELRHEPQPEEPFEEYYYASDDAKYSDEFWPWDEDSLNQLSIMESTIFQLLQDQVVRRSQNSKEDVAPGIPFYHAFSLVPVEDREGIASSKGAVNKFKGCVQNSAGGQVASWSGL